MKNIKHWFKPSIRSLKAYQVPVASGMIKLDAMENPYAWPADLKAEWHVALDAVALNRYPDPDASGLKARLKQVMAVPASTGVMLGNGSDELIQILVLALSGEDRSVLAPEPGFVMYRQIAQALNIRFYGVPLRADDFTLDLPAMLAAIDKHQPALIFIAFPNNPTGNLFDVDTVQAVIRNAPGLVVMDEAYHAFAGQSFVSSLGEFENLLVLRTFSKSGLAGIRLGYLLGAHAVLDELEKIRLPYNINALSQITAEFVLRRYHVLKEQARRICADREYMYAHLCGMHGVKIWPSAANFLLFRAAHKSADEIHAGLKRQGILIKNLNGSHSLLENCLRVTVGTEEENRKFLEALEPLLSG